MTQITEDTLCRNCGHTFGEHAGHHDNGIGGDGSWVDLGCLHCNCDQFDPEEEMTGQLTEAQKRFVELDRRKAEYKQFLEDYKAATEAVVAEMGVGSFFQDEQGVVYQTAEATGRFVYYEKFTVNRTRRDGEAKGTLSMKAALESGFAARMP